MLVGSWLPEILWSSSVFVELVSNVDLILFSGNFKKDWETTLFNGVETLIVCLLYGYNVLPCQTNKQTCGRLKEFSRRMDSCSDVVLLMLIVINTICLKSWITGLMISP